MQKNISFEKFVREMVLTFYRNVFGWRRFFISEWWRVFLSRYALLIALMLAVGCNNPPAREYSLQPLHQVEDNERLTITLVGVLKDDLAYHDRRGIYEIKDNETGRKYFGISGVGISELGMHGDGDPDER